MALAFDNKSMHEKGYANTRVHIRFTLLMWGTCKVRNEIKTKRNEAKRNKTKRNEMKPTEVKRNETKSNEAKLGKIFDIFRPKEKCSMKT